jgi:uncharacterized membrane protein YdjX (TVP38/TMEM64 family)
VKVPARGRFAIWWQLGGLLLGGIVLAVAARHFPLVEYVTRAQQKIEEMEVWGGVLYPLLYAACNVLLLPGGVIAIGSGLFFGLWWGAALSLVGNVVGAAVAFGIARLIGRRWLVARLLKNERWAALDRAIERHGWKIIFLTQVHPLFPTSLLNYIYGVTRIRFSHCMLWVALGQAPGLFLYAYLGTLTQHGLRVWRGLSHPHPHEYVIWIGGLVLSLAATVALGRLALRLMAESQGVETMLPRKMTDVSSGIPEGSAGVKIKIEEKSVRGF